MQRRRGHAHHHSGPHREQPLSERAVGRQPLWPPPPPDSGQRAAFCLKAVHQPADAQSPRSVPHGHGRQVRRRDAGFDAGASCDSTQTPSSSSSQGEPRGGEVGSEQFSRQHSGHGGDVARGGAVHRSIGGAEGRTDGRRGPPFSSQFLKLLLLLTVKSGRRPRSVQ